MSDPLLIALSVLAGGVITKLFDYLLARPTSGATALGLLQETLAKAMLQISTMSGVIFDLQTREAAHTTEMFALNTTIGRLKRQIIKLQRELKLSQAENTKKDIAAAQVAETSLLRAHTQDQTAINNAAAVDAALHTTAPAVSDTSAAQVVTVTTPAVISIIEKPDTPSTS